MDIPTIPGAVYTISSASSCDVTDKASGKLLGTASSGSPFTTPAYSDALTLSDPSALYVQIKTFNFALAALGLLGGGSTNALPAGYIAAEFLEGTGTQYIQTNLNISGLSFSFDFLLKKTFCVLFGAVANDSKNIEVVNTSMNAIQLNGYSNGTKKQDNISVSTSSKIAVEADLQQGCWVVNGVQYGTDLDNLVNGNPLACLFSTNRGAYKAQAAIYNLKAWRANTQECDFLPALDPQGAPCMFDRVTSEPFSNSGTGSFIVGFSLAQARKLSGLPATGGTLTVSLPEGYESDSGVVSALETARSNGWTLTIQTYTPENATDIASTFALRRVWVRRTQAENGTYVAADGSRWGVDWCVDMLTPDGSTPDAHGYELFRSQDAAVAYWELSPWVDPEAEEMMQNELLTNSTAND